jgi:hypothetical protein
MAKIQTMNSTVRAGVTLLLVAFAVALLFGAAFAVPVAFIGALVTAAGVAHPEESAEEPQVDPKWRRRS